MEYLSVGQLMVKHGISLEEARKMRLYPTKPQDEKKTENDTIYNDEDKNVKEVANLDKLTPRKPSLGQIDLLIKILNQLGGIEDHWDLQGSYGKLTEMTMKQYKYLNWLRDDKSVIKINAVLETLKVLRK